MGRCPNCGRRGIFLPLFNCKSCGKQICNRCGEYLLRVKTQAYSLSKWYVCSKQCVDSFTQQVTKSISPDDIDINEEVIEETVSPLVIRTILSTENEKLLRGENEEILTTIRHYVSESSWFLLTLSYGDLFWSGIKKFVSMIKAQNLMKARRFEDAAKAYEEMRMYEKAGEIRAKGQEVRVRNLEVSVDLNSLLGQLKNGGLVVVYRCPHCHAPVKIGKDTSIDSLKACEHCGSEIRAVDVADLLKTALS